MSAVPNRHSRRHVVRMRRLSRLALAAGVAALSLTMLIPAPPAGATGILPSSLGQAGSDTTYFMMKLISGHWVKNKTYNPHKDSITQIPPTNKSPFPASVTVPGDAFHAKFTYDSHDAAHTPPNGSSAGITALSNDKTGL